MKEISEKNFLENLKEDEDDEVQYLLRFLQNNVKISKSYEILLKVLILTVFCIPLMCGIYAWFY
jgi:hypothetical protein